VPDVALNAASHDGYLVELNGNWYDFAGTSAASPTMAAIMALVVQSQSGVGPIGRSGLGNVNPALYGFLSAWDDPFHATPSGNNSVPGVGGFVASGAAFNLATGLGSVDANVLVADWPTASKSPQPSFKITPSVSSVSVISGSTAKVSLALTASGGFLGAVSLTASKLPLGITVQFNPSLLKSGSISTVTLTATNSAAAGAGTILITGTSGDIESSTALAVTVRVAPTLAIVAQAVKITAQQGKSATATVKVNTGGVFSGLLNLAVTGLPAGVSSSWSPSSFQANGTQSFSSTLTLTASVSQTVAITSFNIVASGDDLSAQAPEQLQITAAPGITIAIAPAAISMKASGTGQMVVNVSPVGGLQLAASLSGVKFLASPLPVGVTASWSKPAITASGAIQTVLTLSGSIKAAAGSSTFSVQSALTDPSSHTTYSVTEKSGLTLTK